MTMDTRDGASSAGRARRILFAVDDEPAELHLIREALGIRPISMHTACDVDDALAYLAQEGRDADQPLPDLILLDVHLPRGSGLELLKRRHGQPWSSIPVVVFSSSDRERDVGLSLGAHEYIRKPAAWDDWQTVIDRLVERYLI